MICMCVCVWLIVLCGGVCGGVGEVWKLVICVCVWLIVLCGGVCGGVGEVWVRCGRE